MNPGLREKVEFLQTPENYPLSPRRVECIETHMSWVFLTEHHAWKLKKPVKTSTLDFGTIDKRHLDCLKEIRLNRRLAESVYVDAVPLTIADSGRLELNGDGRAVDWLVQMRRLPSERCLEVLMQTGTVQSEEVSRAAAHLARFYRNAPTVELTAGEYRRRFHDSILENQRELNSPAFECPLEAVDRMTEFQLTWLDGKASFLDDRVRDGRIIDGHGDLRPEHIWLTDPPVIIDCLEFNDLLRTVDPASELEFLQLECDRLNAAWIGDLFRQAYIEITGDHPSELLRGFYRCWHACTRAKLALWHLKDDEVAEPDRWRRKAARYLKLVEDSGR